MIITYLNMLELDAMKLAGRVTTIQKHESLIKGMDYYVKYDEDNIEHYMQNADIPGEF